MRTSDDVISRRVRQGRVGSIYVVVDVILFVKTYVSNIHPRCNSLSPLSPLSSPLSPLPSSPTRFNLISLFSRILRGGEGRGERGGERGEGRGERGEGNA